MMHSSWVMVMIMLSRVDTRVLMLMLLLMTFIAYIESDVVRCSRRSSRRGGRGMYWKTQMTFLTWWSRVGWSLVAIGVRGHLRTLVWSHLIAVMVDRWCLLRQRSWSRLSSWVTVTRLHTPVSGASGLL